MLHCVNLVKSDISQERITSIIRIKGISDVGKTLAVTRNCYLEAIRLSETSIFTKATRYHITEDGILHEEWCLLGCYAVWLL
jgi:hypothetical protein